VGLTPSSNDTIFDETSSHDLLEPDKRSAKSARAKPHLQRPGPALQCVVANAGRPDRGDAGLRF
jgi:hypothetical protein